jgi:demethylmenaquinone methyltransferase/2-methoxy-6-polyprenyl-1,4-benzoquinol methylase
MIESTKDFVPRFFDDTTTTYNRVAKWATYNKDNYWKNEILSHIQQDSKSILELACGTGILTRKIVKKFPAAKIIGIDITKNYLDLAQKNLESYKNITFVHQDAEKLDLDMKFDCIVSSYIPKYCNAKILVQKCVTHLNSGGKIILHDFVFPQDRSVRFFWRLHFVLLNFAGLFTPSWQDAFANLPKLIESSRWVAEFEEEMRQNGLKVNTRYLTLYTSAILIASS